MLRYIILVLFVIQGAVAAEGVWMEDMAAAKAKAKAEGKDLLIDFTGSDWCGWCIKLREEVFDHESFVTAAQKDFILVELDYPQDKPQDESIKTQNAALQDQYKIQGFPTILLTDHEGVVYGRTGYQAGGPEAYLKHISELKSSQEERATALAAAMQLEGMEKVAKLGEILNSLMEAGIEAGQDKIVAEIKALDPDDSKGFLSSYEFPKKLEAIEAGINADKDFDKALQSLIDLLPTTENKEHKQHVYMFMAMIYMKGKQDKEQTLAHYKLAADVDPESELSQQIYAMFKKQAEQEAAAP